MSWVEVGGLKANKRETIEFIIKQNSYWNTTIRITNLQRDICWFFFCFHSHTIFKSKSIVNLCTVTCINVVNEYFNKVQF